MRAHDRGLRVVHRPVWLWRWGVADYERPGAPILETFLTRRGADRFIRSRHWTQVQR